MLIDTNCGLMFNSRPTVHSIIRSRRNNNKKVALDIAHCSAIAADSHFFLFLNTVSYLCLSVLNTCTASVHIATLSVIFHMMLCTNVIATSSLEITKNQYLWTEKIYII